MRQALNLINNWEEEGVVDPYRTTLGGGGASFDDQTSSHIFPVRQEALLQCSNAFAALLGNCSRVRVSSSPSGSHCPG
jgi:hypothetical protein